MPKVCVVNLYHQILDVESLSNIDWGRNFIQTPLVFINKRNTFCQLKWYDCYDFCLNLFAKCGLQFEICKLILFYSTLWQQRNFGKNLKTLYKAQKHGAFSFSKISEWIEYSLCVLHKSGNCWMFVPPVSQSKLTFANFDEPKNNLEIVKSFQDLVKYPSIYKQSNTFCGFCMIRMDVQCRYCKIQSTKCKHLFEAMQMLFV